MVLAPTTVIGMVSTRQRKAMTNPLTKWLKCNHCAISLSHPSLGATPRDIAVYAGHPNIVLLIDEFEKRKGFHKL